MDIIDYIKYIERNDENAVYIDSIKGNEAKYGDVKLHPSIKKALASKGIEKLYSHQAEAIRLIRDGRSVAITTPSASGKTYCFNIPILETIISDPQAKALYIYPLKALAQDQLKNLNELVKSLRLKVEGSNQDYEIAKIYDGDTNSYQRTKIKNDPPNIIMTNPDMLHLGLLPFHEQWSGFFSNLKYVVIDEAHYYYGVLGSHVANVIRRLRRVLKHYGANPQFIACSATLANPEEFIERLAGVPFSAVKESGYPNYTKHLVFWKTTGSAYADAESLFSESVKRGLKTILFAKSRLVTELIHTWVKMGARTGKEKVSAYRAGYLADERREIESELFGGNISGVISTSALELGVDIGKLDVCILLGYPGSMMSYFQRIGRVGRRDKESLAVMIALEEPLNQYLIAHAEDFLKREVEAIVVDPYNREIFKKHLQCAASEVPLEDGDDCYGQKMLPALKELCRDGLVAQSDTGTKWFNQGKRHPQRDISLRSVDEQYSIIDEGTGKTIGTAETSRVFYECYEGAIYLHRAEQYLVRKLDFANKNVLAGKVIVDYYTGDLGREDIAVLSRIGSRQAGGLSLNYGEVIVTKQVTGYAKKQLRTGRLISKHALDMPPLKFTTKALWLEIPSRYSEEPDFPGGLHAIEHAVISLFPLFVLCDRNDIGGMSTPLDTDTGKPCIFVYDAYPGGVGLAETAYHRIENILREAYRFIAGCECDDGCPSCIQDPRCGNNNKPLSKDMALRLLEGWTQNLDVMDPASMDDREIKVSPVRAGKIKAVEEIKIPVDEILFYDLETQKSAEQVGGWDNKHLMKMSVSVACCGSWKEKFRVYREEDIRKLMKDLRAAKLIVGFNIINFDLEVLRPYMNNGDLDSLPVFDILKTVYEKLRRRISLNSLAMATLEKGKMADGLQAITWFEQGDFDNLITYCRADVELTRDLFKFGRDNGYIKFEYQSERVRLPVEW